MDDETLNKLRGIAVGAAVGDAMGMALEFGPRVEMGELVRDMKAARLKAGSFTDDTETALALAQSLAENRALDQADFARRLVDWYLAGPPDIGMHTRKVLGLMAGGEEWNKAVEIVQASSPESAGNGSLMRVWPVAILHWENLDELVVDAWEQSAVTHTHRDCASASIYVTVAMYHMVHGKSIKDALLEATLLARFDDGFARVVRNASSKPRFDLDNSPWVRHTLESSIWAMTTTNTFEDAVVMAVNLGNDADTSGAVVGALAGAAYGFNNIPVRWREAVHGEWPIGSGETWTVNDIVNLADSLAGLEEPA